MNLAIFFEQLAERFGGAETSQFEFKSAQGGLPKSIWETVSAFANAEGGWILLGVREEGESVVIEGVNRPLKLIDALMQLVNDPEKINYPALTVSDVAVEAWGDPPRQVVMIHVPPAPRSARPVYLHKNPLNSFVRMVSGDKRCAERDVKRMLREASDETVDDLVLAQFGDDDLEIASFRRYRQRFQNRNLDDVRNAYDDRRFLRSIGAWGGIVSSEGPTVAGLLMFGKSESIRQWRKRHVIDYRKLSQHPDPQTSLDDRVHWSGNLWDAFEAIYPRLTADLPTPFRLEGPTRIDESYAHRALREALINLLVHADYAESSSSIVERSADGYRFRNPGISRVPAELLYSGDHSDARNPRLVDMFRFVGLAEDAGRGVSTMLYSWNQLGYRRPIVISDAEAYEFTIQFRKSGLFADDDVRFLDAFGVTFSDAQKMALVLARHGDEVTNARLCLEVGSHSADVTKDLRQLRNLNLLMKEGEGRGTSYRLSHFAQSRHDDTKGDAPAAPDRPAQLPLAQPPISPLFLADRANGRRDIPPRSDASPTRVQAADITAGTTGITRGAADISDWASELTSRGDDRSPASLLASGVVAAKRLDPNRLDELIVSLCALCPMSSMDLATTLNRNKEHIGRRLAQLIKSGRLSYEHPERPTHPKQRYVVNRTQR